MSLHQLKTWPSHYRAVEAGRKKFEVRKHDRDFAEGDIVELREYDPVGPKGTGEYTGNWMSFEIGVVLSGEKWGLQPGFCVFSLGRRYS
jgi:hypothetical protein